jgi:hypothetical protein
MYFRNINHMPKHNLTLQGTALSNTNKCHCYVVFLDVTSIAVTYFPVIIKKVLQYSKTVMTGMMTASIIKYQIKTIITKYKSKNNILKL